MKAILNWRYWAIIAIFIAATLCMALAFSTTDDRPILEWLLVHLGLFAAGFALFRFLGKCVGRWEAAGLIPEYSKTEKL